MARSSLLPADFAGFALAVERESTMSQAINQLCIFLVRKTHPTWLYTALDSGVDVRQAFYKKTNFKR